MAIQTGPTEWHELHKDNVQRMKNRPPKLFSLKGVPAEKLLVAALSFRRCKPGHGRMKLGWYDKRIKDARPQAIRSGNRASAAQIGRAHV